MQKITVILTVIVLSALLLSACGTKSEAPSLASTTWMLASYGPTETQTPAAAGVDTRLEFSTDGTVSGTMGCNSFSGSYEQRGGSITFGPIISTEMACLDLPMTQESVPFGIMVGTVKFEQSGNSLTVYSSDGTLRMVMETK